MAPGSGRKINSKVFLRQTLLGVKRNAHQEFFKLMVDKVSLVASLVAKIAMVSKLV